MFNSHLRGAQDVPGGVQGDAHAVDLHRLAPLHGANACAGSEPGAQHALPFPRSEIRARAPAGVVPVRVSDYRLVNRQPRVDVEVARVAI